LHGRKLLVALCLLGLPLGGWTEDAVAPATSGAVANVGSAFDPATAGNIRGHVTWDGDLPAVPPLRGWTDVGPEDGGAKYHVLENPNAPMSILSREGSATRRSSSAAWTWGKPVKLIQPDGDGTTPFGPPSVAGSASSRCAHAHSSGSNSPNRSEG
jgi:hypothetical protein